MTMYELTKPHSGECGGVGGLVACSIRRLWVAKDTALHAARCSVEVTELAFLFTKDE